MYCFIFQDKLDDVLLGIKSTALKFGDRTKLYLACFGTTMISSLVISGICADQTFPYYAAVGLVGSHLFHQVYFITFYQKFSVCNYNIHYKQYVLQLYTLDINDPANCAKKFISNHKVGMILFAGIVLGNLAKNALNKITEIEKLKKVERRNILREVTVPL